MSGEIFNIGFNEENYQIIKIAEMIKNKFPETKIEINKKITDKRNYNVDCTKAKEILGIKRANTVTDAVEEIKSLFDEIHLFCLNLHLRKS